MSNSKTGVYALFLKSFYNSENKLIHNSFIYIHLYRNVAHFADLKRHCFNGPYHEYAPKVKWSVSGKALS